MISASKSEKMLAEFCGNSTICIAIKVLTAISVIALLTRCGQPKVNFKDEEEKIAFAWRDWSKKALTGKPELIAYYFADDALVVGQDAEPIKGKAEMINIYAAAPSNFELEMKWEDEEKPHLIQFSKDGDMAYSLDGMQAPVSDSTGSTRMQRNKVLHIWKKDDEGNWKVSLLMVCPEK
jgi:ketosteroid isomerase-like protein